MKRGLVILLSIGLTASVALATTEAFGITNFIDVESDSWYEASVARLAKHEIVEGYDDATFRPDKPVTRAELSVLLTRSMDFIENPTGAEPWQHYENDFFLYSIDYPYLWEVVEVSQNTIGFRPSWMSKSSVQWAVIVVDASDFSQEALIADMGKNFPLTRSETQESFHFLERIVNQVVVTTSERPTWRHEQIFVERSGKIYIITNGAMENSDFELFWRSLKFLDQSEKVDEIDDAKPTNQPEPQASKIINIGLTGHAIGI